jgi:hypothetical protein
VFAGDADGREAELLRGQQGRNCLQERTATDTVLGPPTKGDTMPRAKVKAKPKKSMAFGGYAVNFKGRTDTLESLFGATPIPPSSMTKKLWDYVKRHRLATKA